MGAVNPARSLQVGEPSFAGCLRLFDQSILPDALHLNIHLI